MEETMYGNASDISSPDTVRGKRSLSRADKVFCFLEGFVIGFMLACTACVLFYLGVIEWTNHHE